MARPKHVSIFVQIHSYKFKMLWALTLTLLVTMTTATVAMEVPITRHFTGGFQCDFCYPMTREVHGWTAHVLFDRAVDTIEVRHAQICDDRLT